MSEEYFFVYMMASGKRGTIYRRDLEPAVACSAAQGDRMPLTIAPFQLDNSTPAC